MTHTYSILEVSAEAYDEIAEKLKAAGYDDAFHSARSGRAGYKQDLRFTMKKENGDDVIDMHGIALSRGFEQPRATEMCCDRCEALEHVPDGERLPMGWQTIDEYDLCYECAASFDKWYRSV